jgi:outer membrane protein assembly factor BamB
MEWYDTPIAKLFAINQDGTLKWAIPFNGNQVLNCVIDSDGTIYVGSNDEDKKSYKLYA